jgi:hypothetical protein
MCTLPSDSGRLILIDEATTYQNREGLRKYEEKGKIGQGAKEKKHQSETPVFGEEIDEPCGADSYGPFY